MMSIEVNSSLFSKLFSVKLSSNSKHVLLIDGDSPTAKNFKILYNGVDITNCVLQITLSDKVLDYIKEDGDKNETN